MVFSLLRTMLGLDGVSNTADGATLCGAMCFLIKYGSHCVVPLYCVSTTTPTTKIVKPTTIELGHIWIFHRSKILDFS